MRLWKKEYGRDPLKNHPETSIFINKVKLGEINFIFND